MSQRQAHTIWTENGERNQGDAHAALSDRGIIMRCQGNGFKYIFTI